MTHAKTEKATHAESEPVTHAVSEEVTAERGSDHDAPGNAGNSRSGDSDR